MTTTFTENSTIARNVDFTIERATLRHLLRKTRGSDPVISVYTNKGFNFVEFDGQYIIGSPIDGFINVGLQGTFHRKRSELVAASKGCGKVRIFE